MTTSFRQQLIDRFQMQATFAADYAPRYSRLFAILGEWCAADGAADDELVQWLLTAGQARPSFDIPLLILAGLHQAVLASDPAAEALADYYPTAGRERPLDDQLPAILRQTILALRDPLTEVIQQWQVQTNETGRGSVWLLPLTVWGWSEVDLVDLGASAGLNLAADFRRFEYRAVDSGERLGALGKGGEVEFEVQVGGESHHLRGRLNGRLPTVVHRIGCDLLPFRLNSERRRLQLMSYVWADQPQRLVGLRAGIAAAQQVDIQLEAVRLPEELPRFLAGLPTGERPLVIYNTFIKQYFRPQAHRLDEIITEWAEQQPRPIVWLQWEPTPDTPSTKRLKWTADHWQNSRHRHQHLGWVHPHGLEIEIENEIEIG